MFLPLYDTNPHRRIPWLTLVIIAINVIVMIQLVQLPEKAQPKVLAQWGFVPKRISQLSNPQLVVEVNLAPDVQPLAPGEPERLGPGPVVRLESKPGQIYLSLFSMMFLHGGYLHLASNMWFLWIFGNNIEDRLGHLIYVCFYLLGGLLAALCHWATDPTSTIPVIGASGAVAAVLGAYAITYPTAKVRTLFFMVIIMIIDVPAMVVLGLWFLLQLVAGIGAIGMQMHGGVAWWAHVGGFVAGLVLMPILSLGTPPPEKDWREESDSQFKFPE